MTQKFQCTCGKVNQFTCDDGHARYVKARCGSCGQVCRMEVPARDSAKSTEEFLKKLAGVHPIFGDPRFGRSGL